MPAGAPGLRLRDTAKSSRPETRLAPRADEFELPPIEGHRVGNLGVGLIQDRDDDAAIDVAKRSHHQVVRALGDADADRVRPAVASRRPAVRGHRYDFTLDGIGEASLTIA